MARKLAQKEQIDQARRLWVDRVPVRVIAETVDFADATIYYWRARYHWPHRPHGGHPRHQRSPEIRALAKKLWQEGVPRRDIAGLCDVSVSALGVWRRKGRWARRYPGRSTAAWEEAYRGKARDEARPVPPAPVPPPLPTPRYWRCNEDGCSRLNLGERPSCSACGSPNPMPPLCS